MAEVRYLRASGRKYVNPAVLQLASSPRDDPEAIIRTKAEDVVRKALGRGWEGPPFNQHVLASMQGITTAEDSGLVEQDALLRVSDASGRLEIRYNPDRPTSRQNFSIAHELSHTLLPGYEERVQYRKPGRRQDFNINDEVEFLCDLGASELLLPLHHFALALDQEGFTMLSAVNLAAAFEASREAVAIRMIRLARQSSALVFYEFRLKPSQEVSADPSQGALFGPTEPTEDIRKMRVEFCIPSRGFPHFLPASQSVEDGSIVNRAAREHAYVEGIEKVRNGKQTFPARVEALPLTTYGDKPSRVIAFIYPVDNDKALSLALSD